MIKILILNFIFIFSITLVGQDIVFPTANAKWCYNQYGDTGENLGNECFEYEQDKVMIDGLEYGVLIAGNIEVYIREDSNRVYLLPNLDDEEVLLYDFNLEIGDLYQTDWGWSLSDSLELMVTNIDSVEIFDGSTRKIFTLQGENGEIQWLEGIGDLRWLFFNPAYFLSVSGGYSFLCHIQDGGIVYSEANGFCTTVDVKEVTQRLQLSLSPNPFTDSFRIDSENLSSQNFELYNSMGILMEKKSCFNGSNSDCSFGGGLSAGLYYFGYRDDLGDLLMERVVKVD